MTIDEFSVARARKQNQDTAGAVEESMWDSVGNGLNVLVGEYRNISRLSDEKSARSWAHHHLSADASPAVMAALLAVAIERLARR